jgi:Flp pilus assembly pilin Flp
MSVKNPFRSLLRRLHRDERGAVSLETILIIGAIALPILIWLVRWGWPMVRGYFQDNMDQLGNDTDDVMQNN